MGCLGVRDSRYVYLPGLRNNEEHAIDAVAAQGRRCACQCRIVLADRHANRPATRFRLALGRSRVVDQYVCSGRPATVNADICVPRYQVPSSLWLPLPRSRQLSSSRSTGRIEPDKPEIKRREPMPRWQVFHMAMLGSKFPASRMLKGQIQSCPPPGYAKTRGPTEPSYSVGIGHEARYASFTTLCCNWPTFSHCLHGEYSFIHATSLLFDTYAVRSVPLFRRDIGCWCTGSDLRCSESALGIETACYDNNWNTRREAQGN